MCLFLCEPNSTSPSRLTADTPCSPIDFLSVSGSGTSRKLPTPSPYIHIDYTSGKLVELVLVPITEPFTIDIAVGSLPHMDIAVNCTLRFLVATSLLAGLRLIGVEFNIPALLPKSGNHQHITASHKRIKPSIELSVSPTTISPMVFPTLFRPSSWFMTQTVHRPQSIGSGTWNPTCHHKRDNEDETWKPASPVSPDLPSNGLRQSTWDDVVTPDCSLRSQFAMPMSLSEYRRVGLRTERWASNVRCRGGETPRNETSADRKDIRDEMSGRTEDSIKVRDLRQILFFLLPYHREVSSTPHSIHFSLIASILFAFRQLGGFETRAVTN